MKTLLLRCRDHLPRPENGLRGETRFHELEPLFTWSKRVSAPGLPFRDSPVHVLLFSFCLAFIPITPDSHNVCTSTVDRRIYDIFFHGFHSSYGLKMGFVEKTETHIIDVQV